MSNKKSSVSEYRYTFWLSGDNRHPIDWFRCSNDYEAIEIFKKKMSDNGFVNPDMLHYVMRKDDLIDEIDKS